MAVAVVVEDEWSIRMQVSDTLIEAGWQVTEFASGEQAVAYLDSRPEVALLVTDIRLGGPITGWDVAEAFRVLNPKTKVIYCSGNTLAPERQVPDSVFLAKPCRMEAILQAAATWP